MEFDRIDLLCNKRLSDDLYKIDFLHDIWIRTGIQSQHIVVVKRNFEIAGQAPKIIKIIDM
jgi:hypothetical protein